MNSIRQLELFSLLSDSQWEALKKAAMTKTFFKKEIIFTSDETKNYYIIILSGRVKVYLSYPNGKEFTLGLLNPGDIYTSHAHVNASALSKTALWIIPDHFFRNLSEEQPAFFMQMIPVLGHFFGNAIEIIHSLVYTDVRKRIVNYFIKNGTVTSSELVVVHSLSMGEFANYLGSTRQTISTILNQWNREGMIELEKNQIRIKDPEMLLELTNVK